MDSEERLIVIQGKCQQFKRTHSQDLLLKYTHITRTRV